GCETREDFNPVEVTLNVNKWLVAEAVYTCKMVQELLSELRFNDAASTAYHFVWDEYCDWYLELIKPIFNGSDEAAKSETRSTAAWVRDQILILLHPFMPFITEELWG